MHERKRYPSIAWLLVQAAIMFSYTIIPTCSKPYRQEIQQKDNTQRNNQTLIQATDDPSKYLVIFNKVAVSPSTDDQNTLFAHENSLKSNANDSPLDKSVIFKAIVSNIDVLTLKEENTGNNGGLSKHFTAETKQEHKDTNSSSSSKSHQTLSKAHLKWDGHVVAAPLKYDPHTSNFQTPKKVSDTISTSKMVLSLLTAAVALGTVCVTVAIFQCCCRRKQTSDDEEDDNHIESDKKEKVLLKQVDTDEKQFVESEINEKNVSNLQTDSPIKTSIDTPKELTTNGETVEKASEEKEEQEVSVKDKIKAFETQALKPFSPENAEQHRTLIKRPHSKVSTDGESEALSASTTLIMGQVFRKRADTEKCQRKEAVSKPEKDKTDDDYFGIIGRETEVLKSYRRAPAPRNRNKATKALYRKTMPIMDSGGKSNMEINMCEWESTMQSFQQIESPLGKQELKKKSPIPLPNQKVKEDNESKTEDSSAELIKTEKKKTDASVMEVELATDTNKLGSTLSIGLNKQVDANSSGDEASQGEEVKIKEEMKEETNKEEKEKIELKKEKEEELEKLLSEKYEEEKEEEKLRKEKEEKEKQDKEEEDKENEEEKVREEHEKKEEEEGEKDKKDEEELKKEKERETDIKAENEKQLKKKETKREKDEMKKEKEELNKEELKKGKELENGAKKTDNIFSQIDPTAEPTRAKLVKRDSAQESNEINVSMRQKGDSPQNDHQSPKSRRHLSHLDRSTLFMLPGQKPENQMSLMLSLKEKLNDKKEKNELDTDAVTDTKMEVDHQPEMEKSE